MGGPSLIVIGLFRHEVILIIIECKDLNLLFV